MILALALVIAGNVWQARERVEHIRTQVFTTAGQIAASYNAALDTFVGRFETQVINGTAIQQNGYTVANPLAPTIVDLAKTVGLPGGVSPGNPFWGGSWRTSIAVTPAGCVRPNCIVTAQMWATQPITKGGKADLAGAGIFVAAAGGAFGYSGSKNPSIVAAMDAQWTAANPLGGVAGAVLATSGGANALDAIYIRRDGGVTWTGDQDVNGVNLNNVGTINGQNINLAAGEALNVASGAAVIYSDGTNASLRTGGNVSIQNADGSAPADIAQVGNVTSSGTVAAQVVNFNTTATSCSMNQVRVVGNNVMSVCSPNGTWVPISQLVGNVMTITKYLNYSDGMTIAKPTCPAGTATAAVIPQSMGINVAVNPPIESDYPSLVDGGTFWTVSYKLKNASGTLTSANTQNLTVEVDAQCYYANE